MNTTKLPRHGCPVCLSAADAASDLRGDAQPKPGDITVCLYCASILEFDEEMRPQRSSASKLAALNPRMRLELELMRNLIRQQRAQRQKGNPNVIGPGKYDDICTNARLQAQAEGAVLIIASGKEGSGFSVQGPMRLHATLPDVLEQMAEQIRIDWASADNPRAMSEYQSAAYALLTIGKAAGAISREDVRRYVVDSLRQRNLNAEYLVSLRDHLDDVLREASGDVPATPYAKARADVERLKRERAVDVIARLLRVHEGRDADSSRRIAAQMLDAATVEGDAT